MTFSDCLPVLRSICVVALLSCAPALFAAPPIKHWQTANGARVYFIASDDLPILDVSISFAAGEAFAPADKTGVAGLTRSLLDAGAGPYSEEDIADRWVDLAAQYSTSGDADRSTLRLRTLANPAQMNEALALLRTIMSSPTFPDSAIQREKARSIEAIRDADTRPDVIASKAFFAATYGDHPYGRSASVASVGRIRREDLLDYYRQRYTANQAVIAIVGALSYDKAQAIAAELIRDLPQGAANTDLPPVNLPSLTTQTIEHPAQQSHIHVGMPTVARGDADYFPLLVGNYTLGGGGFVSRLMKEVREKHGYAYSVGSYFAPMLRPGLFDISLQTQRERAQAALAATQTVLTRFLKEGPTPEELGAAKSNLANSLALRIDSNAKLLDYLTVIGFYRLPLTYLDDFANHVETVTLAQIRAAFARHVQPGRLVTVIVAPQPDTQTAAPAVVH